RMPELAKASWNWNRSVGSWFQIDPGAIADDVIGHEYMHAVNFHVWPGGRHLTGLQGETINEGLSDVFGEFIDWRSPAGNDAADKRWVIGEDLSNFLRNLRDPSLNPSPTASRVGDEKWIWQGSNPYRNTGVIGRFAYLITDGAGSVSGLGESKS